MIARTFGFVAPLVCFVLVTSASAQERTPVPTWLTVRGAYAIPTGAVHQSLDAGPAAGVRLEVPFAPALAGYFSVDGSRAGFKNSDAGRTSLLSAALGASFTLPGSDPLQPRPFVDAGASLNRWSPGTVTDAGHVHSDWSPGVDFALGVHIPATARIRFDPALRYRWFRPDYDGTRAAGVSSLGFEVGVGFRN